MKVLVLSNFYPPHFIGGYELGCSDVVEALNNRGYDVRVLTSTHGVDKAQQSERVYRWLETDLALNLDGSSLDLVKLLRKESTNQRAFARVCEDFSPDVLYVWNATHISISIALKAHRLGMPVCYFISDHWLSEWENDALYSLNRRAPRKLYRRMVWKSLTSSLKAVGLLSSASLNLANAQFASRFLKEEALRAKRPVLGAEVIHWGIDVNRFRSSDTTRNSNRLLYVGQLTQLKGIETAVRALKLIVERRCNRSTTLTIVGGPDYENRIHRLVSSLGLEDNVRFTGLVPRDQLPSVYEEHDILLFPSVWAEPFSLTVLEAMSSGLAIVGTTTGGSREVLRNEDNALTFPKEDAGACAEQVIRLLQDRELRERLRRNGRRTVEDRFRLDQMIDKIDVALKKTSGLDASAMR